MLGKNPTVATRLGALGFLVSLCFPGWMDHRRFARGSRDGARHWFRVHVVTAGLRCVGVNWVATGRAFSDSSFSLPSQDLKKYGATTVVRVCEVTYDKTPLEKDGITVMVGGQQDRHQRGCPLPPPMLKYPQPSGPLKPLRFR